MSTHRKIEWALFILGLIGVSIAFIGRLTIPLVLCGISALFAGLHVFHVYDGRASNRVIIAASGALVVYIVYMRLVQFEHVQAPVEFFATGALAFMLFLLSLRLHRDFRSQ